MTTLGNYKFSNSSNPSAGGTLTWSSITGGTYVTHIHLNDSDDFGVDQSVYLAQITSGDIITWYESDRRWVEFRVTSTPSESGGIFTFPVSLVEFDEEDGNQDLGGSPNSQKEFRFSRASEPVVGFLTNASHVEAATSFGSLIDDLTDAGGTFQVFQGVTEVTSSATFSVESPATVDGMTMSINSSGVYSLSGTWTGDVATFDLTAVYGNVTTTRTYSIAKSKEGEGLLTDPTAASSDGAVGDLEERIVFVDNSAMGYFAWEDNTNIYIRDASESTYTTAVSSASAGTEGTLNVTAGQRIISNKPVSLWDRQTNVPSLAYASTTFVASVYRSGNTYKTFRVFAPYADAEVEIWFGENAEIGDSPVSTSFSVPYNTFVEHQYENTGESSANDARFVVRSSAPVIFGHSSNSSATSFTDSSTDDQLLITPPTNRTITPFRNTPTIAKLDPNGTVTRAHYVSSPNASYHTSGDTLFFAATTGDGDGSDAQHSLPQVWSADNYAIPKGIDYYQIVAIEPTVVRVYRMGESPALYATHDLSAASETNILSVSDGAITGSPVATSGVYFRGTGRFAVYVNPDPDGDELISHGWYSKLRTQAELDVPAVLGSSLFNEAGTLLADIDVANDKLVGSVLGGSLISNPSMDAIRAPTQAGNTNPLPVGWYYRGNEESEVNANGDTVTVTMNETGGWTGILVSSAWRVNPGTEYEITVVASSTDTTSINFRVFDTFEEISEYGKYAVSDGGDAAFTDPEIFNDSDVSPGTITSTALRTGTLTSTLTAYTATYAPASNMKYASVAIQVSGGSPAVAGNFTVDSVWVRDKSDSNIGSGTNLILAGLDTFGTQHASSVILGNIFYGSGDGSIELSTAETRLDGQSLRHNHSDTGTSYDFVFFATSASTYNIPVEAGKKYIFSAMVHPSVDPAAWLRLRVRGNDGTYFTENSGNQYKQYSTLTANTWQRVHGVFEASSGVTSANVTIWVDNNGTDMTLYYDELMLEEYSGNSSDPQPSTFVRSSGTNEIILNENAAGQLFTYEDFGHNNINRADNIWDASNIDGADVETSIVAESTATGGYAYEIGNNSGNDQFWRAVNRKLAVPVSPGKVYRVSARARRTAGTSNQLYFGVAGFKGDVRNGNGSLVNVSGSNTLSSQHYSISGTTPTLDSWQEYEYYWTPDGAGSPAVSGNTGLIGNPDVLHQDVEFVSPLLIANYSGQAGTYQLDYIKIQELAKDQTGATPGDTLIDTEGNPIPQDQVITGSAVQALGFNGSFSDWPTGANYPDGWGSWVSTPPSKEQTNTRVGSNAVRFYPSSSNMGMVRTADAALSIHSIISGSIDVLINQHVSGNGPGLTIDLFDGSAYYRQRVTADSSKVGSWQTLFFALSRNFNYNTSGTPSSPDGLRIYIMASWSGLPAYGGGASGSWNGDVIFDNLQVNVFDPAMLGSILGSNIFDSSGTVQNDSDIQNTAVTINADGSISGAGGGQVTIGGLGYVGDLNATRNTGALADEDTVNLATTGAGGVAGLLPTGNAATGLRNSGITINTDGTLGGAGSGQANINNLPDSGNTKTGASRAFSALDSSNRLITSIFSGSTAFSAAELINVRGSFSNIGTTPLLNVANANTALRNSQVTTFETDKSPTVVWTAFTSDSQVSGPPAPYDCTVTWRDGTGTSLGITRIRMNYTAASPTFESVNHAYPTNASTDNTANATVSFNTTDTTTRNVSTATLNGVTVTFESDVVNGISWSFNK